MQLKSGIILTFELSCSDLKMDGIDPCLICEHSKEIIQELAHSNFWWGRRQNVIG